MKNLQELKLKLEGLRVVFDNLEESALLVIDKKLRWIWGNASSQNLIKKKYKKDGSFENQPVFELLHQHFKPVKELILETFKNQKSIVNFTFDCKKNKQQYQTFIVNTSLMDSMHPIEKPVLVIIHDITELTRLRNLEMNVCKYGEIVGQSDVMQTVFSTIASVKDYDTNVLITGETGTGKEVVARTIHKLGNRKNKPFIPVQVSALPENILESEIFGHVKGSFTGATSDHPGRIKMADKGTLFLDEIGTFPESVQIKLLRFLQEKIIEPVGGTKRIPVDVRIIAATNESLTDMVENGTFREDLLYRLKIMEIKVPPLRDRKEDIPYLMETFVKRLNINYNKNIHGVSPNAMRRLLKYPWPGNVRELENAVEHAMILADGAVLTLKHFPVDIRLWAEQQTKIPANSPPDSEPHQIMSALKEGEGNVEIAADKLDMHRTTLWRKMKEHGIDKADFKN